MLACAGAHPGTVQNRNNGPCFAQKLGKGPFVIVISSILLPRACYIQFTNEAEPARANEVRFADGYDACHAQWELALSPSKKKYHLIYTLSFDRASWRKTTPS